MNIFRTNTIKGEVDCISDLLKLTREEKKISIEKASTELGINRLYLDALEKGKFAEIPTGVYGKNYFREYAQYLNLNDKKLMDHFGSLAQPSDNANPGNLFVKQTTPSRTVTIPKLLKNLAVVVLLFGCFTYLGLYLKNITAPPVLAIVSPGDSIITDQYSVDIKGRTEPEANIVVNGESVLSDPTGAFEKEINLKSGINEITITARKKYSRANTVTKQILVKND